MSTSIKKFVRGVKNRIKNDGIDAFSVMNMVRVLQREINEIKKATNENSSSGDADTYKGKPGDIKINKIAPNKYDFYIRGEDGWHRDNNASYGALGTSKPISDPPEANMASGSWEWGYQGNNRLTFDLDKTNSSSAYVPTPEIKSAGNLKISTAANKTVTIANKLTLSSVAEGSTDYDKFLVLDGSNNVKYRTGAQLLEDAGYNPNFRDIKMHQFYTTDANQDYMPFGASHTESDSTASGLDDDTLFIAPFRGVLEKIVLQSETDISTDAGITTIALRVNGTTNTGVNSILSDDTTATFTWTDNNSFAAGDRIRLSIDPTNSLKYVTATSVWKYVV